MAFAKKLILEISLCVLILLSSTPGVAADRDGINYSNRISHKRPVDQNPHEHGNDDGAAMIKIRPQRRSRASLLSRAFLLALIFWTLKFVIPRIILWIRQLCRDITEFFRRSHSTRTNEVRRRGRNSKSHRPKEELSNAKSHRPKEELSTLASDAQSISPSLLEIIDMADGDDDGSSFISNASASASSISSVSTFFGSLVRSRSSRRSRKSPLAAVPERFVSSPAHHSTMRPQSKPSRAKNSNVPTPIWSQQRPYMDEENGNMIDEDQVRIKDAAGKKQHRSKQRHNNEWLDDISQIPMAENIHRKHGINPKGSRKSGSPLDRKINSSSRENNDVVDGHSRQKDSPRGKQNNHRRNRRRSS